MSFWKSRTGRPITGDEKSSFLNDNSVIPEGTLALTEIKSIKLVDNPNATRDPEKKYYEFLFKIVDGDFIGRTVSGKIKCFFGEPDPVDRHLNMLKRIMDLCNLRMSHSGEPTEKDLMPMCGKRLGIKIGEWSMTGDDGTPREGNLVRETHSPMGFKCETGVKKEFNHVVKNKNNLDLYDSALSRNSNRISNSDFEVSDDVPF